MIELPNLPFSKVFSIDEYVKVPSDIAGIYFIFDEDRLLVYVGQAKSIRNRIQQHSKASNNEEKLIYRYYKFFMYAEVSDPVDRELYETYFINKCRPPLNRSKTITYKSRYKEMMAPDFIEKTNINKIKIRQELSQLLEEIVILI